MNIYLAGAMPGGVEKRLMEIYLAGTERIRRDVEVVGKGGRIWNYI